MTGQESDRNWNPRPGCLVDSVITVANHENIYLQSHTAIVGTARPTHYVVLHKSDKTPIRDIQEMTFNLCYLYGKSVSSFSLISAAYYADKVCDCARCHYRRAYALFAPGDFNPADFVLQPHRDVRDRMFII
jgi:eukaryotic translation initiation factor 2C